VVLRAGLHRISLPPVVLACYNNNNTLFKYRVQRVFEKEDHEVIPI